MYGGECIFTDRFPWDLEKYDVRLWMDEIRSQCHMPMESILVDQAVVGLIDLAYRTDEGASGRYTDTEACRLFTQQCIGILFEGEMPEDLIVPVTGEILYCMRAISGGIPNPGIGKERGIPEDAEASCSEAIGMFACIILSDMASLLVQHGAVEAAGAILFRTSAVSGLRLSKTDFFGFLAGLGILYEGQLPETVGKVILSSGFEERLGYCQEKGTLYQITGNLRMRRHEWAEAAGCYRKMEEVFRSREVEEEIGLLSMEERYIRANRFYKECTLAVSRSTGSTSTDRRESLESIRLIATGNRLIAEIYGSDAQGPRKEIPDYFRTLMEQGPEVMSPRPYFRMVAAIFRLMLSSACFMPGTKVYRDTLERYDGFYEKYMTLPGVPDRKFYYAAMGTDALARENYSTAERAFRIAAEETEGLTEVWEREVSSGERLSDAQIEANLLWSLFFQGKTDEIFRLNLPERLIARLKEENLSISERFTVLPCLLLSHFDLKDKRYRREQVMNGLKDACSLIRGNRFTSFMEKRVLMMFPVQFAQSDFIFQLSSEEEGYLSEIFETVLKQPQDWCLSEAETIPIRYVFRRFYLQRGLTCKGDYTPQERELLAAMSSPAMGIPVVMGELRMPENRRGTDLMMQAVRELIYRTVRYMDDDVLTHYLSEFIPRFKEMYLDLLPEFGEERAFEALMLLKAPASLVGREQNRMLYQGGIPEGLVERIKEASASLTQAKMEMARHGDESAYEKARENYLSCEVDFEYYAKNYDGFVRLTSDALERVMPEHTLGVEFFTAAGKPDDEGLRKGDGAVLHLYYVRRDDGRLKIRRHEVGNAMEIIHMAREYAEIMQRISLNEEKMKDRIRFEKIRGVLFEEVIRPILSEVRPGENLVLAPEGDLMNVPLETLKTTGTESLSDRHEVVRMECLRDYLFYSGQKEEGEIGEASACTVIGNPDYSAKDEEMTKSDGTDMPRKTGDRPVRETSLAVRLPFSEVEANMAAVYLGGEAKTGRKATKSVFLQACGSKVIHLATHGIFDLYDPTEVWYSSQLLLAGYNTWLEEGQSETSYGNGILTAKEIGRMDLRTTELVILSSCMSGLNVGGFEKGLHGMVGAFMAAGVRYVIANLWSCNDLSSLLLMDLFYRHYVNDGMTPVKALREAKHELGSLTIRDLHEEKRRELLQESTKYGISSELIDRLLNDRRDRRPFQDEKYGGAAVCYQCYGATKGAE